MYDGQKSAFTEGTPLLGEVEGETSVEPHTTPADTICPRNKSTSQLGYYAVPETPKSRAAWRRKTWWKSLVPLTLLAASVTFVGGTALLFAPGTYRTGATAGWLFTMGSLGFLLVDIFKCVIFKGDSEDLSILAGKTFGAFSYFVGSIGYIPPMPWDSNYQMGIQGFIWGSIFMGVSHFWKIHRLCSNGHHGPGFSLANIKDRVEVTSAVLVELALGIGAWCFLAGTIMYWVAHVPGSTLYLWTLIIWEIGSVLFFGGGCLLTYRYFGMGLSHL